MDIILLFFDHPPTSLDIFYVLHVDKNGKFLTTYPPSLVHVVIECPLSMVIWIKDLLSIFVILFFTLYRQFQLSDKKVEI